MIAKKANQGVETVPVMDGARLARIITRSDIMNLLLRGAQERQNHATQAKT
ncbi:hypothetical protein KPG71_16380 [Roseovarius sp. PS-C2]|uniref:hypothetical protein n=1 Tax=Roseovarius sp. PS-C2 TaxID=2820814 RepID=UPI001C0AFAE1|nr:hypothetical protein [Roseovarius sp. PS-C2]MBU3261603.1 hypothetical protein [Roseovarius sp. PS-C2]